MPFLGKQQATGFISSTKQDLTPDGSTVAFTLDNAAASANDIEVFVGNVRQEPTDAYTVSGTTLTMSAAPASGVNFYVIHKQANQSATVPAAGTSVPGDFGVNGTLDVTSTSAYTSTVVGQALTNMTVANGDALHLISTNYNSGPDMSFYGKNNGTQFEVVQINASGLSFDGGSNHLDDYEEGTLSWVIKKSDGSAGTDNGSNVKYTKIGQTVFIVGKIRYDNNASSGTGNLELTGSLPFVPNVTGGIPITHIRSEDGSPSTMAAVTYFSGSADIFIHQSGNDYDTNNNNLGASVQTNLVLEFCGHYTTSS